MAGKVLNKIVTNGLILCLDAANPNSYPGSGTTWYDLSSGNNNATLVSGSNVNGVDNRFYPQFKSNNLGYFECTGSGAGGGMPYIEIANDPIFNFGKQSFTIEYWFKKYNTNISYSSVYGITKWAGQGGGGEWLLNVGDGTDSTGDNYFISVYDGSNLYRSYIPYNTIQLDTWYQLVGIRDGAYLKTYLNGQLKASVSPLDIGGNVQFTVNTTIPTTQNKIRINRSNSPYYTSVQSSIASAKIYNRALSDQEVLQNFNALKTRFGLVKEELGTKANVQTYGAKGDGVTDDTAAIQRAINENNTIYFPAGVYMINQGFPLADNFTIIGDGPSSILRLRSDLPGRSDEKTQTSVFVGEKAYSLYGLPSAETTNGITIKNLTIDLQKPNGLYIDGVDYSLNYPPMLYGIRLINPNNCIIDNVTVLKPWQIGIGLYTGYNNTSNCSNNVIRNCTVTLEGYWYKSGYGPNEQTNGNLIYIKRNSQNTDINYIGIEVASVIGDNNNGAKVSLSRSNTNYTSSRMINNEISNNTVSGGSHGISVSNVNYTLIKQNNVTDFSARGIIMISTCDYNTIQSNTVTNIGSTGIHLAYNCQYNTASYNNVDTIYGQEGDGIKAYVNCNNNLITYNSVNNAYTSGIRVAHGANNNVIKYNSITGSYPTKVSPQKGIKILANTAAQYTSDKLTFSNQLTAQGNICTNNTIINVALGIAGGDEMNIGGKYYSNTVSNNTYTNVGTSENLNVTSTSY